jgi:hypothetical protein
MRFEHSGSGAPAEARKVECLRDKQGQFIGRILEPQSDRLVGYGAATVLLTRPKPTGSRCS